MATWRCPHCGTPQNEAARCWVCHRSTTSCSTCRYFRQGVTAGLGYCALDRHRAALTGAEERPCWERSTREATSVPRAPATTLVTVPVAPWSEDGTDEVDESVEIERELAVAAAARAGPTRRPSARRMGLGLLDDEPEEPTEPTTARQPETPGLSIEGSVEPSTEHSTDPADDLWSFYLAGPSPLPGYDRGASDATVRSAGMWVESLRSGPALPPPQPPLTARHRNSRSVRHRPWGPVPGREDALVRSLRMPERIRRPRS